MTVNEIMNLVRLYRKEPKLAIAGERAKQIRAELIKACRVPDGFKLVPNDPAMAALDSFGLNRAAETVARASTEIERLRAKVEALRADAERLDSGQIMIDTLDEFGEPKRVWHTGMDLRKAIDAARAAQGDKT